MKVICPNNSSHKKFITVAHVSQDWEVDEFGMFLGVKTDCCDVISPPNVDNLWTCSECGAEAIIE